MPKVETFDRDIILSQATTVFHDLGYNATSMQDLVDATGLNRSSIYNSFTSKKNLFLECLKFYENKNNREISKKLLKASNGFEAIQHLFEFYIYEMTKASDDKGCLIVNCKSEMANHENTITNFLTSNQQRMLELLEDLIFQGQQDHSINKLQSASAYALYIYSSIQGFRVTGILVTEPSKLKSISKTILQTLI